MGSLFDMGACVFIFCQGDCYKIFHIPIHQLEFHIHYKTEAGYDRCRVITFSSFFQLFIMTIINNEIMTITQRQFCLSLLSFLQKMMITLCTLPRPLCQTTDTHSWTSIDSDINVQTKPFIVWYTMWPKVYRHPFLLPLVNFCVWASSLCSNE